MTLPKPHRQRRKSLLQPLLPPTEVAEAVELVQAAAVGVASGVAVVGVAVFAVGAGQGAPVSVVREAGAIGPIPYHQLVSANWIRIRYPRSLRSHRRSPPSARSSYGIAAKPLLRLPKSSATADRLAANRHG
jgi:hypothetical protein